MCGKKLNISLFSKKLVLLNLGKKKKNWDKMLQVFTKHTK